MTIEIIEAELQNIEEINFWVCWLEVNQGSETYLLPATAPGDLQRTDLQTYFETNEAELFQLAREKAILPDDIYDHITRRVLKAFALVVLDEVNLLRSQHGLVERTAAQLRTAVKSKLKSF
jgi:hypothetical protein